jgi:NADH:ubiquinone oxidoreductase subunit 5 (subunit L)/multisubunit Na+/H+ antiporter MnhA subunit
MQLWLIPLLPLAGFLINGIFGRRFSKSLVNVFAIGSVALAFAWVVKTLFGLGDTSPGSRAASSPSITISRWIGSRRSCC